MKKLLLLLQCVPLMFSCGEKEEKDNDETVQKEELQTIDTTYANGDEENARSEMYIAEFHFQRDSFNIALNGDGQFSGFLSIANKYSNTEVGNIANYYAAICQMNLGSSLDSIQYFENALSSLNNFETDSVNEIISSLATGLKGDAKMELGDTTEAMNFYKSAATDNVDSFTSPYFMMKQARIHELKKEFTLALEIYNTIKSDYPESKEAINIKNLELLNNDQKELEKFSRENFLMKKDNEDIIIRGD
jgi:tetratricopeptide (TPR) repeat protein